MSDQTTPTFEIKSVTLNPFKMHLADAITAAHISREKQHYKEIRRMLARTSVIHSVIAVECAANCCIYTLPKTNRFLDKAEKWGMLDKFDLYLMSRPGNPSLSRGDKEVQALQELITFRDDHVHPRSKAFPTGKPTNGEFGIKVTLEVKKRPLLIPMHFGWDYDDAKKALTAATDFLRYFCKVASLSPAEAARLFTSRVQCDDGERYVDTGNFEPQLRLASTVGINLDFMTTMT